MILDHLTHIDLTSDQQEALRKLQSFLDGDEQVFILTGFAGSGKTTILKGLIDFLQAKRQPSEVMAPTGRAAKILRDKAGAGQTVHKSIYNFEKLQTIQDEKIKDDHSFRYFFPIRKNDSQGRVLIIDEASMISSKKNQNELFTFGTDILLNDLITYSGLPTSSNKLIFVGDPAQLPPVGDNASKALQREYFEELGLKCACASLTEVVRQKDNTILENATLIRSILSSDTRSEIALLFDEESFLKTQSDKIPSLFADDNPLPDIGESVIIAFSNQQCLQYNQAVRKKLFPGIKHVTDGDLLIINHNNYHTYGVELMNGEMVKVMSANQDVSVRSNIPVYVSVNGDRVKKHITLTFRKISIRTENHPNDIDCLIIDSLLSSGSRDLTVQEMKALYVDFVMRFQEEQKNRKERGLPSFGIGSEEFAERLRTDPYYNALRVKYGYAITCHKAQGGEWNTTFVDYYGRTSLKDDPLRWSYTATTRAVNKCFAANAPLITSFSEFQIGDVLSLTKIPEDALSFNMVPLSPHHKENHHLAKSMKFWEVKDKIDDSPFQVVSVDSLGDYHERYTIACGADQAQFDCYHNGAGIFKSFTSSNGASSAWIQEVLDLLNEPHHHTYNIDYQPSHPFLEELYSTMQALCVELEIGMTNIVEKLDHYYVIYYLKTDSTCALIQFYFNGKQKLTRAMPKSTDGMKDNKLNLLITKLQENVV